MVIRNTTDQCDHGSFLCGWERLPNGKKIYSLTAKGSFLCGWQGLPNETEFTKILYSTHCGSEGLPIVVRYTH
jgi:hypothetical protein